MLENKTALVEHSVVGEAASHHLYKEVIARGPSEDMWVLTMVILNFVIFFSHLLSCDLHLGNNLSVGVGRAKRN